MCAVTVVLVYNSGQSKCCSLAIDKPAQVKMIYSDRYMCYNWIILFSPLLKTIVQSVIIMTLSDLRMLAYVNKVTDSVLDSISVCTSGLQSLSQSLVRTVVFASQLLSGSVLFWECF